LEPADGKAVLTYWEAIDAARALARRQEGDVGDDSRPLTVDEALDRYEADLKARGGDTYNAHRARFRLPGSILGKPVALLGSADPRRRGDARPEQGPARDPVTRLRTCLRAALSLAARRDRRIKNRHVWEEDLEALPNATVARNVVLADDDVARLI